MTYDIFISYKRKGTSSATAAYLYQLLLNKGYNVFFDRKEMRSGKFNEQLLEHISNATDVIILLEPESLSSWFNYKNENNIPHLKSDKNNKIDRIVQELPYQSDWFCREVMHALIQKDNNVVPILLNGYIMPTENELPLEMKELSTLQALSLDISEIEEFYQKYFVEKEYLKSKPKNLAISRQYKNNGAIVGSFLFYTDAESCELYEHGEHIYTLTDNNDEEHPFIYNVTFAGEHRFRLKNNNTGENIQLNIEIDLYCQKYIYVKWQNWPNIWNLSENSIKGEEDSEILFIWGKTFYDGTTNYDPDIHRSILCLEKAASQGYELAIQYIYEHGHGLVTEKKASHIDALKWYISSGNLGNTLAQIFVGNFYREGRNGINQDYTKALEWYTKAAEKGNAEAQINIGVMYLNGEGVEQDNAKALEWFTKAAEQGDERAQVCIGIMYHDGEGVEQDYTKALEWFTKAAEKGDAEAQVCIGIMYYDGEGVEQDYTKALEWFTKGAEQGDAVAQTHIGYMYRHGEGVEQDYTKALEWFTKAAEQGYADAQTHIGYMYRHGEGVEQDYTKALEWFTKAAEQGDAKALYNIGQMYRHGEGVEQDYTKALEWFTKAAEQGDTYAQTNLGNLYENGQGTKQDYTKALEWFTKAADHGHTKALYNIGQMYRKGKGVNKNYKKAIECYKIAAEKEKAEGHEHLIISYFLYYQIIKSHVMKHLTKLLWNFRIQ